MPHNNKCSFYRDITRVVSSKTPSILTGLDVWDTCDHCETSYLVMRVLFPAWYSEYDKEQYISELAIDNDCDFKNG